MTIKASFPVECLALSPTKGYLYKKTLVDIKYYYMYYSSYNTVQFKLLARYI